MKKARYHIWIAVLATLTCAILASGSSAQLPKTPEQGARPSEPPKREVARLRAEIRHAVAAINKNKAESEALAAAVRSKNAGEVGRILTGHGVSLGHAEFSNDYTFCWHYINFHWYWLPCIEQSKGDTWNVKG